MLVNLITVLFSRMSRQLLLIGLMLLFRFISGLSHGAYFGIASSSGR